MKYKCNTPRSYVHLKPVGKSQRKNIKGETYCEEPRPVGGSLIYEKRGKVQSESLFYPISSLQFTALYISHRFTALFKLIEHTRLLPRMYTHPREHIPTRYQDTSTHKTHTHEGGWVATLPLLKLYSHCLLTILNMMSSYGGPAVNRR